MHGVVAAAVLTHLLPLSWGRWRGMGPQWGQVGWRARQCCVGDVAAVPTQLAWLTCHQPLFGGRRGGRWGTGAGGPLLAQPVRCQPHERGRRGGGGCSREGLLLMMTD
jgi:hypothetical protein